MSHAPDHSAPENLADRADAGRETAGSTPVATSPNSAGLSIALFVVVFAAFCLGLYIMSLMSVVPFVAGLAIVLLSLFATFTLIPKFLT